MGAEYNKLCELVDVRDLVLELSVGERHITKLRGETITYRDWLSLIVRNKSNTVQEAVGVSPETLDWAAEELLRVLGGRGHG